MNDAKFSKLCILGSDVEPCFEGASVAGTGEKEPVKLFAKDDTPEFVRALLKMREQLTYALHNEGGLDNVKQEKVVEEVEQAVITDFDDASDSADSSTETASIEEGTEADDETAPTVEDSDTQEDEPEEDSEEESEALISSDVDESIKKLESDSAEEKEAGEGETDFAWQTEVQEVVTEIKTTTDEFIPAGETEGDKIVSTKVEITETNRVVTDREVDDEPGETTIEPEEAPVEEAPVVLEAEDAEDSLKEVEAQFAAVNQELEEVKVQFANLQADYDKALDELEALRSFKLEIENKEKDAEIAKYFMLSDEDKAEVIAHKSEYTLAEIQSKLAVLYVEKNVDFNTLGESEVEEKAAQEIAPITTFSLDAPVDSTFNAPEWVQALIDRQ